MRILVVHAWLRGNVGDVLQLSVLFSALRELKPRVLDLSGFPARPGIASQELLAMADHYIGDPFLPWKILPSRAAPVLYEPLWRARRKRLFSRYDAIVCAPGPYLADYDPRLAGSLCDIRVATELGRPVVLASHSVGPLQPDALAVVAQSTLRIARESTTHQYLEQRGISCSLAADLAFLYPYVSKAGPSPISPGYRAVFLRSNNLDAHALRIVDGALLDGTRPIADASSDRIVLATSDYPRDKRFLSALANRLGVSWVGCQTVAELVRFIGGSSAVISDRYHPAICGASLGKPARVVINREPHKMEGLRDLLADRPLEDLQRLARTGLGTVRDALSAL